MFSLTSLILFSRGVFSIPLQSPAHVTVLLTICFSWIVNDHVLITIVDLFCFNSENTVECVLARDSLALKAVLGMKVYSFKKTLH